MISLKEVISKVNYSTETSSILYGTAVTDSSNGEVLVKLDDAIDDSYISDEDLIEVDMTEEADTEDAIDDDVEIEDEDEDETDEVVTGDYDEAFTYGDS